MTLEQLRIFIAVAESLHVTRAAAKLNLTQSAASASIAALEARYHCRLFHRTGRRIELTDTGKEFLAAAKAVMADVAQAESVLSELSGLQRGHLDLQASQTIANYWLPPLLQKFHQRHPGIRLSVTIGNTASVARAVLEGQANLGFIEGDIDEPILTRLPVQGDELVLVVGKGHPWAGQKRVTPAALQQAAWVMREPGSGTRQILEDALRRLGVDPARLNVALELPSNEAVRSAVIAGAGITALSSLVVDAGLRASRLHRVGPIFASREFLVLRHGERHHSKAETALLEMIRQQRDHTARRPASPKKAKTSA
ncbi:MAG TPA: LysR substrate-binding domain-containing protein [Ferrovibrio sp.]|jgi:DNA-binding transcriptional LysR family regulator|uniref:LysR substrate-binding domain-containing protein n=1 Tax=Ferrovibrio sp. TaxID=1917215 RepID=UPI002ED5AAE1